VSADETTTLRELLSQAVKQVRVLRARLDSERRDKTDQIAIIGVGCRFPAGVRDMATLWSALERGVDGCTPVPSDRWAHAELYDPDPDAPGKTYMSRGGFLDDIRGFDNQLFGISPAEAASMDPQQRLLLEVAWEALENAGYDPSGLSGSSTGVFIGSMYQDYLVRQLRELGYSGIGAYLGTGNSYSAAVGRLSYAFGLQGPSLAVDTACSSSLVSVHLACQSLLRGECDLALAGGVNIMSSPETSITLSKARMLSPSGRSRTFDRDADGYVRGEGCGLIVLKRLRQAEADHDHIRATVLGSGINQDGRSNGLTAPNGEAQKTLIGSVLHVAGVAPEQVGYVECHGSATPLGDPIEVNALGELLGHPRRETPLFLGSVKTNFGHLEGAAGICGLIKTLLVLERGQIPPNVNLETLNPHIRVDARSVKIPQRLTPWESDGPRIAGVSAFGFAGTNAHVVLRGPARPPATEGPAGDHALVLPLSARTPLALRQLSDGVAQHLTTHPDDSLADVCYTAATTRATMGCRRAVVANTRPEMIAALKRDFESEVARDGNVATPVVAFLMTGQGSQVVGMGRTLADAYPEVRHTLEQCDALFREHLGRPILPIMFGEAEASEQLLARTEYTQPALFTLEYALVTLWRGWGLEADLLLGHSIGEVVAACIAGVLTLEDATRLVAARGRLMQRLPGGGAMAAVFSAEADVSQVVPTLPPDLSIAAVNAPDELVLSGGEAALESVLLLLNRAGLGSRRLDVSHAFHSPLMRPMLAEFSAVLDTLSYAPARLPIVSTRTGRLCAPDTMSNAAYWADQVLAPVRFDRAVNTLLQQGVSTALEIGPRPVLGPLMRRQAPDHAVDTIASLTTGDDERAAVLQAAATLFAAGAALDWDAVCDGERRRVPLPTYPFQHRRFWFRTPERLEPAGQPHGPRQDHPHPLLGAKLPNLAAQPEMHAWTIARPGPSYLTQHRLMGVPVWPISAQIELALATHRDAFGGAPPVVRHLRFEHALRPYDAEDVEDAEAGGELQAVIQPAAEGMAFELLARDRNTAPRRWQRKSRARLTPRTDVGADGSGHPGPDFSLMFFAATDEDQADDRYGLILEAAKFGDTHDFSSVWIPERHFTAMGSLYPNPSVLHAALARETSRIGLRAGSVVLPLHNPVRVAEEWAMVDNLSDGRVGVSFASGWNPSDFVLAPGLYADRYQSLHDGIARVRALWRGETVTSQGPDGAPVQHRTYPTPIQPELPLWITAARSPTTFRQAGELGANVLTHLLDQDIQTLGTKIEIYRAARRDHGWDPDTGRVTVMCHTFLASTMEEVHVSARRPFCDYLKANIQLFAGLAHSRGRQADLATLSADEVEEFVQFLYERFAGTRALIGTPATCLAMVAEMRAVGVDEIACLLDFGPSADHILTALPMIDDLRTMWRAAAPDAVTAPPARADLTDGPDALTVIRERCTTAVDVARFYRDLASRGVEFDDPLRNIEELWVENGEALARVGAASGAATDTPADTRYVADPVVLNGCLQVLLALVDEDPGHASSREVLVPVDVLAVRAHAPLPAEVWCHGVLTDRGEGYAVGNLLVFGADGTSVLEVEGLRAQQMFPDEIVPEAKVRDTQYRIDWRPLPAASDDQRIDEPGISVIFADRAGVGDALADALRAEGGTAMLVAPGATTRLSDPEGWTLEPGSRAAAVSLLEQLPGGPAGIGELVYLWPLDATPSDDVDVGHLSQDRSLTADGLLALTQALVDTGCLRQVLTIVTRGAEIVAVGDSLPAVSQALTRGIGRAIAREHPEIFGGLIDLAADVTAPAAAGALRRLLRTRTARSEEVAVRDGQLFARRLARHPRPDSSPAVFHGDAAYLITGGLGGIGLELARWMVSRGARHLILMGRRALPPRDRWSMLEPDDPHARAVRMVLELEAQGCTVTAEAVDIASATALSACLDRFRVEVPNCPIRGVFHAAGIWRDQSVEQMDLQGLVSVLEPKVDGTWVLDQAFRGQPLDHFVMFSSFSSVMPPHGQANYAAASAFQDAVAHIRQVRGDAAISINWGPWSDVGLAATRTGRQAHEQLERLGVFPMTVSEALAEFDSLLADAHHQLGVIDLDVDRVSQGDAASLPGRLLADLVGAGGAIGGADAATTRALEQALSGLAPVEQLEMLTQLIAEAVAQSLEIERPELETARPLTQLGMDSIIGVQIKNQLQKQSGITLPLVELLKGRSVDALAEHFLTRLKLQAVVALPTQDQADAMDPAIHEEIEL
jgi:natural product biosynthesis luciferase-like monooxygenase protein